MAIYRPYQDAAMNQNRGKFLSFSVLYDKSRFDQN